LLIPKGVLQEEVAVTLTRIAVVEEVTDGNPREIQLEPAAFAGGRKLKVPRRIINTPSNLFTTSGYVV
jgi:hypothetical protein